MAKKFFARARLVKSARWAIDYTVFDPVTGTERRHRKDFDLNDIPDLATREAVAERLIKYIEHFVPAHQEPTAPPQGPTLCEAVALAVGAKQSLPRKSSRRKYQTVGNKLLAWAKYARCERSAVRLFTKKDARAFWDALLSSKEYRGKTTNNYLDALRSLWNELGAREIVDKNPWESIKPAREEEKARRPFTDAEKKVVARYAMETDYWLFRGILLQYYCYVRPCELVRLRFKDFDLGKGTVTVSEANAKSYRRAVKTIPTAILCYFIDGKFEKYPANFFMYGNNGGKMEPGPRPCSESRPYKRHAKLLVRLNKSGQLSDIAGLSWYSWKDTGISAHAAATGPVPTKDQAAHKSLAITSIYYHAPEINQAYKNLCEDLIN